MGQRSKVYTPPSGRAKVNPRRYRPDKAAIHLYQKFSELVIDKLAIQRIVRHISNDLKTDVKFQCAAITIVHHACEEYLIRLFEDKNVNTIFRRGRITPKDVDLARRIRGTEHKLLQIQ